MACKIKNCLTLGLLATGSLEEIGSIALIALEAVVIKFRS